MNQYLLRMESKELQVFPYIIELAFKKITTIQFNSLKKEAKNFLRFYYVIDGKFEWIINNECHILFPGDLALVLPNQVFGGEKDFLDIGTVAWLHIESAPLDRSGKMNLGKWSNRIGLATVGQ